MDIRLITKKDGRVTMNRKIKDEASLESVCFVAENEVYCGYADYACVKVNGKIYIEVES